MKRYRLIARDDIERIVNERVELGVRERCQALERERMGSQMDMALLQAQINPHFLYNTLDCIRGHALSVGARDIADITQLLSRFFRYSISSRSLVVPLWDELENVGNYMRIQQYRFKDRFAFDIHNVSGPEALEGILPKLTLQPIIENAVIHGFKRTISNAHIVVTVDRTAKHLNISVWDNGCGMDRETLARICGMLKDDMNLEDQNKNSIGLGNVDKRLKLFFGPEYGLTVESAIDVGTEVSIHIPYRV